jgi:hypothetical protein
MQLCARKKSPFDLRLPKGCKDFRKLCPNGFC